MKLKRIEAALFIALAAAIMVGAANNSANNLTSKLVRLHVVANSDSQVDQELKLMVRDRVLELTSGLVHEGDSQDTAMQRLRANAEAIRQEAQQTVNQAGYDYQVQVSTGIEEFDTRQYDSFSLPGGEYQTLRITLGEGQGKNWWCVVFPPICLASCAEELSREAIAAGLTEDDVALITGENQVYVLKFKLVELVQSIKMLYNN